MEVFVRYVLVILASISMLSLVLFFGFQNRENTGATSVLACIAEEESGEDWYWRKANEVGPNQVLSFRNEREEFLGYHILARWTASAEAQAFANADATARTHVLASNLYAQNPAPFNLAPVCYQVESENGFHSATVLYRVEHILLPSQTLSKSSEEAVGGFPHLPQGVVGDF